MLLAQGPHTKQWGAAHLPWSFRCLLALGGWLQKPFQQAPNLWLDVGFPKRSTGRRSEGKRRAQRCSLLWGRLPTELLWVGLCPSTNRHRSYQVACGCFLLWNSRPVPSGLGGSCSLALPALEHRAIPVALHKPWPYFCEWPFSSTVPQLSVTSHSRLGLWLLLFSARFFHNSRILETNQFGTI